MKRALVLAPVLALLLPSCLAFSSRKEVTEAPAESSAPADTEKGRETAAVCRKLDVARAKLEVAHMEAQGQEEELAVQLRHAKAEIGMAEAKLAHLVEADMPARLATARLDLRTAKDRAQEAADELAQIEIMYKEQDLDDLTAEFVVSRGRRNAERAAARIEIQENKLRALEERELPQEMRGLELAVDKAVAGLAEIERKGEIGMRNKRISVREAENAIAKLEDELAEKNMAAKP